MVFTARASARRGLSPHRVGFRGSTPHGLHRACASACRSLSPHRVSFRHLTHAHNAPGLPLRGYPARAPRP